LTKKISFAKRFPSLSTVNKHFSKNVFWLPAKSRKHVSDIPSPKSPQGDVKKPKKQRDVKKPKKQKQLKIKPVKAPQKNIPNMQSII
jgi:hypothetical protein